jgi:hypothetical protein
MVIPDLIIDGLPPTIDSEGLSALFSRFGTVLALEILETPQVPGLRLCAVTMASSDQADRARDELNLVLQENHIIATFEGDGFDDADAPANWF